MRKPPNPTLATVQAVNLKDRLAILSDDSAIPITHLFSRSGKPTNSNRHAVAAVAGPSPYGWYTIDLTKFDRATTH